MKLTEKQLRFCEAYLLDPNATQAAIKAGYSKKTAHRSGAENLQKCAVVERLAEARAKLEASSALSLARCDEILAEMAEDTDLHVRDRQNAIQMAVKRKGGFLEKLEVKGEIAVNLVKLKEL